MSPCLECTKSVNPRAIGSVMNATPFGFFCSGRCAKVWYKKRSERRQCAFCGAGVDVARYEGKIVLIQHVAPLCEKYRATCRLPLNDIVAVATVGSPARPS